MFPAAVRLLHLKDLKDLRALLCRRYYRHAGPNGPEEVFFAGAETCEGPALRARQGFLLPVRDLAIPNYRLGHRARERLRGTGPRATVGGAASPNPANRENLVNPAPNLVFNLTKTRK